MSLSLQVLDFYDDIGKKQLFDVAASAPGFVKSAQIAQREEVSKLPSDHFAIHILTKEGSRMKKYPTHTAADTWLSCGYFEKNAFKLPTTAAKITATHLKEACQKFGIQPNTSVEKLASSEKPNSNLYVEDLDMRKTASAHRPLEFHSGADYALNGRYPLFNEGHVKKAASYFSDYYGQFSPKDRHTFATNLMKKAEAMNLTFDGEETALLRKVAGSDYGNIIESQLTRRMNMVDGDIQATEQLSKVASAMGSLPPEKFAELLHAWDNEHNMSYSRTSHILDAFQSTFDKGFEKEAGYIWEDESSGISLSGSELEKAASEKYDKIKGYFGETLAGSLKKHGSMIFESLPVDAKAVIAKIAKGTL